MTLKKFYTLDETEKWEAVWNGELVADYKEQSFRYVLYQLDAFYVELRYHMEHNVLTGLRAFDDMQELEPYLKQIELHQTFGKPKATLQELRDCALQMLPSETIKEIQNQNKDQLVLLNYSLGLYLRNHLDLWHTTVYDDKGQEVHPDDLTLTIIREILNLNKVSTRYATKINKVLVAQTLHPGLASIFFIPLRS
jgi:hypothetical protein